jgi:vacuolar-type H+-ATPase subunit H
LGACGKTEKPGPLEKAGKSADEAIARASEKAKKEMADAKATAVAAGKDVAEKADKVGEQVSEGAKKMGEVAKETTEGVKKELQKAERMPGPTPTRAPRKKWMNE